MEVCRPLRRASRVDVSERCTHNPLEASAGSDPRPGVELINEGERCNWNRRGAAAGEVFQRARGIGADHDDAPRLDVENTGIIQRREGS